MRMLYDQNVHEEERFENISESSPGSQEFTTVTKQKDAVHYKKAAINYYIYKFVDSNSKKN